MRIYIIAAAVIALTQPALAAKSHHKKSHRHHVSHHSHHHRHAAHHGGRAFVRTSAIDTPAFGNPFFLGWQQAWSFPTAPRVHEYRSRRNARVRNTALDAMIARHAAANGLPVELVHRVVKRESGYNPHARNGSNLGLMQIKYATARGVGYNGPASGLMDPETNLTYATRYLAGAYRAAGGNANRAVALYASGYYGRGVPN
jgi:soluble lytic murein transglycosylase-like protein